MLRLGEIAFINNIPLAHQAGALLGQDTEQLLGKAITYTAAPPKTLNTMLLHGELDVSAVSSVFYAQHQDELTLLPGPCIASNSPVLSVLYCQPKDAQNTANIGLPDTSETSIFLLKWMLFNNGDLQGRRPSFETYAKGDSKQWLQAHKPFLAIGDEALRLYSRLNLPLQPNDPLHRYDIIDLSRYWRAQTDCPCVFAVWAARNDWANQNPEAMSVLTQQYRDRATAFRYHPVHRAAIFQQIQDRMPELYLALGEHGLQTYLLDALHYELNEACQDALAHLSQLVATHSPLFQQDNSLAIR